jgi:hypothetical protein
MNNRNILTPAIALLLCASVITASAQDEMDALSYSQIVPQGTARSMGFGSALGSVGGDFSSLSVNPAGIGVYRTSELTFTPSLKLGSSTGTYQGTSSEDDFTRFNMNNFGLVLTSAKKGKRYDNSKWKSTAFGIGFNRLGDYHRNYRYSGFNSGASSSSGSEVFAVDANNGGDVNTNNTPAGLGYQTYLIEYQNPADSTQAGYFYSVVPYEAGITQGRTVTESGRYNELAISFGGNYMEKLLIGGTIGIPTLRYKRTSIYKESTEATGSDNPFGFNEYSYRENLVTKGTGINLKLGFIYKATDQFRLGAAIHTPTFFSLNDEYSYETTAQFSSGNPYKATSDIGIFSYTLATPWRGVLSATGIIGKIGFITADVEYVGYNTARYTFGIEDVVYEDAMNQAIRKSYKGASNIRIGGEVRPTDILMVRLGFGYYGSPYKNAAAGGERIDVSAGLGFRFQEWFIDLAYVNSSYKATEQPYVLPYAGVIVPTATVKNTRSNAALTIGFKF